MCGIGGLIGLRDEGGQLSGRLLAALRHRGPDDEGVERPLATVALVHTRLAILDLTPAGHQPMHDCPPTGIRPNWIVFNGEIFGYRELARELAAQGWPCRTGCDTEVILHAFRVWGEQCAQHLRGMFAFCLLDTERGVAHLYRDRFGIKPLYIYWLPQGGLMFASELRTILSLGPGVAPRRINAQALEGFWAQGAVQGYDSLVEGITMLRPGGHLKLDAGTGKELSRREYWDLKLPSGGKHNNRTEQIERLRSVARDTVALHLLSDAPLGLFLSSGVDSTSVLSLAREVTNGPLLTLTVGFDHKNSDESTAAARIAKIFGAEHVTVPLGDDNVTRMLDDSLAAMDQPTVDGFNTYFISRAAHDMGLTVALSGLGGDELFGGYASFTDVPRALSLRRQRLAKWPLAIGSFMLRNRLGAKIGQVFKREADPLSMYLLRRELFLPDERRALQALPQGVDPLTGLDLKLVEEIRDKAELLDETNQISFFELQFYMRHMLLRDADGFSMATPIEYRVPFLDHVFAEAIFDLPGDWKKPDPRPKPLLIDIAGSRLPSFVSHQPKRGFAFPWKKWLSKSGPLFERGREALADSRHWTKLGVCPSSMSNLWTQFSSDEPRLSPLQILAPVALHYFSSRYGLYGS
jgi:asparagine synthase (glutamine-hydrolysing)